MLNVYMQDEELVANGDDTDDMNRVETTVFQLAGVDRAGLLADVTHLLTHNGCNVRSAAVWTYKGRVAFVLSVTEKGQPVQDAIKLERLRQLVTDIMLSGGGAATVRIDKVRGEVHNDRRLHQLMLQEEVDEWERQSKGGKAAPPLRPASPDVAEEQQRQQAAPHSHRRQPPHSAEDIPGRQRQASCDLDVGSSGSSSSGCGSSPSDSAMSVHANGGAGGGGGGAKAGAASPYRSPKFDRPVIEITHCAQPDYWTASIRCRDRTKLLFDTVCTLADLDYDIYHATIDSTADGMAQQEYYLRPRSGDGEFSERRAALLKAMLAQSIERRFPKGLKVHVRSLDRFGCLAALTRQLEQAGLSVTRAKVRTFATSRSSGHTLYVMDAAVGPPDRERVQEACQSIGGRLVEVEDDGQGPPADSHRFSFSFSFLNRQWNTTWGGSPTDAFSYGSL
jgi:predicted amino acid-binding ACT domain protein